MHLSLLYAKLSGIALMLHLRRREEGEGWQPFIQAVESRFACRYHQSLLTSAARCALSTMHTMGLCSDGTKPGSYWKTLLCDACMLSHARRRQYCAHGYLKEELLVIEEWHVSLWCFIWCTHNTETRLLWLKRANGHTSAAGLECKHILHTYANVRAASFYLMQLHFFKE